ncbi:MAG: hypothetical protein J4G18_02020 [Anaerolineae bacterium]|nr:hypothetical protein [Anaerolineae bacterium]
MRLIRALLIWLNLLLLSAPVSLAQDTGQICLLAYADNNENGIRDEIEAPISRGVAASLLNERGITIASLLLQDAADGLLCFDGLFAGDYQVLISSSEYQATTATSASASVHPGEAPARIDFGAKRLVGEYLPDPVAIVGALDPAAMQTLIVAALAAAGAIVLMSLLGVLIYFLFIRRRLRRRPRPGAAPLVPLAGLPPHSDETDAYLRPRQRLDPNQGSPLLFADDDTDLAGSS